MKAAAFQLPQLFFNLKPLFQCSFVHWNNYSSKINPCCCYWLGSFPLDWHKRKHRDLGTVISTAASGAWLCLHANQASCYAHWLVRVVILKVTPAPWYLVILLTDLCHHEAPFWGIPMFCSRRRIMSAANVGRGNPIPSPKKLFIYVYKYLLSGT